MKLFSQLKKLFFSASSQEKPEIIVDSSHMLKKNPGSWIHFIYALLFGLGITAALWQHGSPTFTLAVLFLVLPATCLLFIPYLFAGTLLRRMLACGIFFGACAWITFRLGKGVPFDLALIEGLILSSFAFLVNAARKDCHYLFLISLFLLIYAGLITRKLLLFLVPGTAFALVLISLAEREEMLATGKLLKTAQYSVWRNIKRSWHLFVLHALIALPIFALVLSFIPMQETREDGLFEVSFATSRTSAMPPDLQKWLRQDRQTAKTPEGELLSAADDAPDSPGKEGPKTDIPDAEAELDGSGRGSPPGKDLLYTVSMPVKLYHLVTLYDVYNGKKWQLSRALANQRIQSYRRPRQAKKFMIDSRYTVHKWISAGLCAPYRPTEYKTVTQNLSTMKQFRLLRALERTDFSARFSDPDKLPSLPFSYHVISNLLIPYLPQADQAKGKEKKPPELSTAFDDYLNIWTTQEKAKLERLRKAEEARQKRLAAAREKQKKLAALKARQRKIAAEKARKRQLAEARRLKKSGKKAAVNKKAVRKKTTVKPVKKSAVRKKAAVRKKPPVRRIVKRRPVYDPLWLEKLPKSHYLQLPAKLSPKIAALGKSIAKDHLLPYQKATALRDYLRNNYQYRLYAERTPKDKESVEYFLFELKEGHCEYFAAALAVLARTQGLPSRVATGFSPGNYNALTRQFEIYEYHAHAWTQIYIEKVGWLTFDATPPSEIPSDTTPLGIGQFRDPFGDEWRVMPPELTANTLTFVKKIFDKEIAERQARLKKKAEEKERKTDKVQIRKKVKTKPSPGKPKIAQRPKPAGVAEHIRGTVSRFKETLRNFASHLLLTRSGRISAGLTITGIILFLLFYRKVFRWGQKLWYRIRLSRCLKLFCGGSGTPEQQLHLLYRGTRLLLQAADMPRKNNQELLAYAENAGNIFKKRYLKRSPQAEDAEEKGKEFSASIYAVFTAYYALEYGSCPVAEGQLTQSHQNFNAIARLLREIYPHGLFFMEKLLFSSLI